MKFSLAPLIALVLMSTSVMALPVPAPAAAEPTTYTDPVAARALEKRSNDGTATTTFLIHHTCPRSSCTSNGQYAKGAHLDIVCSTVNDTTVIEGDARWVKLTDGNWVAMAYGHYFHWSGEIPPCHN